MAGGRSPEAGRESLQKDADQRAASRQLTLILFRV